MMAQKKKSSDINISFRLWYGMAVAFLVLPVIIFFAGYLRWYIGIPFALLFAGFGVYAVLDLCRIMRSEERH